MSSILELLGCGLPAGMKSIFADRFECERSHCGEAAQHQNSCGPRTQGFRLLAQKKPNQAKRAFSQALSDHPDDCAALIGLACAFDELGLSGPAAEQLHSAAVLQPHDSSIWFAIGFCHEKQSSPGAAEECYRSALRLQPHLVAARQRLIAIHLQSGDLEAAIDSCEQLAWLDPGDIDLSIGLAHLYAQAGRLSDAVSRYEFAITMDSAHWAAAAKKSASGEFRRPESLPSNSIMENVRAAAQFHTQGDRRRAAGLFKRAVTLNERMLLAHLGLAAAHAASGELAEAENTLKLAAGMAPITSMLSAEIARLERRGQGRSLAALVAAFRRAAMEQPENVDLHYRLGLLLEAAEDPNEALSAHVQALAVYPSHTKALARMSVLLYEAGDIGGAVAAAGRAAAPDARTLGLHYELGLMHADPRQFRRALGRMEHATVDDEDLNVAAHLQVALDNMGLRPASAPSKQDAAVDCVNEFAVHRQR